MSGMAAASKTHRALRKMRPMSSAFPVLHTPRLVLRELVAGDAPALFAIHADAAAMRWFGADPPASVMQVEQLIAAFAAARLQATPATRWGVVRRSDGALLGSCGLFRWNRSWQSAGLGYELARSAQGQGLMSEAVKAVLQHGRLSLQLERVDATVHPDNAPSIALLERLGFVREGLLRQAGRWGGARHDLLVFGLLLNGPGADPAHA